MLPLWSYGTKRGLLTKKQITRKANELRRARTLGADCRLVSERDWCRMLHRYHGLCAYCQEHPGTERDHIIPLKRGGRYSIGNLLPVCEACNVSKNAKLLVAWKRTVGRGLMARPANLNTYAQRDREGALTRIALRGPLP